MIQMPLDMARWGAERLPMVGAAGPQAADGRGAPRPFRQPGPCRLFASCMSGMVHAGQAMMGEMVEVLGGVTAAVPAPMPPRTATHLTGVQPPPSSSSIPQRRAAPPALPAADHVPRHDLDLGGDELKLVHYSVAFLKPDHEKTLVSECRIVNYATTAEQFELTQIAIFMQRLNAASFPLARIRPTEVSIPREDLRYLRVYFKVVARVPKQRSNTQRRIARSLTGISKSVDRW